MSYFAIILGILPGFAWLTFYLREDSRHPEPRKIIFFTFLLGGIATFIALYIEIFINSYFQKFSISDYSSVSFLSFAFIEEFIKFFIVFWFVRKSKYFDEPVDAMIYTITIALGFATIENIGATINQWNQYLEIGAIFHTVTLRFIGATLLHSLSSALVGYYWAKGIRSHDQIPFIFQGLVIATLLHAFFNYLIINGGAVISSTMFLLIIGLFILNDFEKLKSIS